MNIITYQAEKHVSQLVEWLQQWNMPLQVLDLLPTTGLIIENTAAIFCYQTDSKVCFIECLICNKETKPAIRNEALDKLVDTLMHLMKEKGFKYIGSNTDNPKVVALAARHGFKVNEKPVTYFMRSL